MQYYIEASNQTWNKMGQLQFLLQIEVSLKWSINTLYHKLKNKKSVILG
jgi:uncharacterized protein YlbG (UPF0298 family)